MRVDEDAQRVWWTLGNEKEGFVHEIRIRDMSVTRAESGVAWMLLLALVAVLFGMLLIHLGA